MRNNRTKVVVVVMCAQCPHFVNSSAPSKVTGVCSHSEKQSMRGVLFGYTPIPHWCPLPDAKEDANGTA